MADLVRSDTYNDKTAGFGVLPVGPEIRHIFLTIDALSRKSEAIILILRQHVMNGKSRTVPYRLTIGFDGVSENCVKRHP